MHLFHQVGHLGSRSAVAVGFKNSSCHQLLPPVSDGVKRGTVGPHPLESPSKRRASQTLVHLCDVYTPSHSGSSSLQLREATNGEEEHGGAPSDVRFRPGMASPPRHPCENTGTRIPAEGSWLHVQQPGWLTQPLTLAGSHQP